MTQNRSMWPEAFAKRIRHQFPGNADILLDSLRKTPAVSIRINDGKFAGEQYSEQVQWCNTGFFLKERPVFATDPLWHAGAYYVQEASSMFLEKIFGTINTGKPLMVLDLCAAPGGKSTHLNSLISHDSLLVSNEVIRSRVPVLMENLTKWGHSNVIITNNDAKDFGESGTLFDILVVDAPCSGEGLFRKHPEAANEWSVENTRLCAARQRRILTESWKCLKNGGYLIYSTCTFNPAENEENLSWFKSQANFNSIQIPLAKEWNVDETEYNGIYCYRFLPHKVLGEGFFTALLQKTDGSPDTAIPKRFKTRLQKPSQLPPGWITAPENRQFFSHNGSIRFIPAAREKEILFLFDNVNVIKAGTIIGHPAGNDIIPDHEIAMSLDLNRETFADTELTYSYAIKYLQREQFELPASESGWQLVTFHHVPLGFVKMLKTRFNNYYPKEWRLRMNTGN